MPCCIVVPCRYCRAPWCRICHAVPICRVVPCRYFLILPRTAVPDMPCRAVYVVPLFLNILPSTAVPDMPCRAVYVDRMSCRLFTCRSCSYRVPSSTYSLTGAGTFKNAPAMSRSDISRCITVAIRSSCSRCAAQTTTDVLDPWGVTMRTWSEFVTVFALESSSVWLRLSNATSSCACVVCATLACRLRVKLMLGMLLVARVTGRRRSRRWRRRPVFSLLPVRSIRSS